MKNLQMFEPTTKPRVFAVPIGADFSKVFVSGLFERAKQMAPHEFARTVIYVNTRRAARRIQDLFKQQSATLLPEVKVFSDLSADLMAPIDLPMPVSALQRRLHLAKLVAALIENQPELASKSSIFALSDSLAALIDELHGEGVPFDRLKNVDVGSLSDHWKRSLEFLNIITEYWAAQEEIDTESRQRAVIEAYAEMWRKNPPDHPIIIAGSTGSRGATALFMESVANLPQGSVVLPGVDLETPQEVWQTLISTQSNDDHPQSMLARITDRLGIDANTIELWDSTSAFSTNRNKIISLALRPAPVTDQWLEEGPKLTSFIEDATKDIDLISASSPKEESSAISICLREAAERDETAVLISPDRNLTRRVAANLERWNIIPDDSAGEPLHLSPIGIFLRITARLIGKPLEPAELISVLKHPLTHKSANRNEHLRFTRDLELAEMSRDKPIIRGGPPHINFDLIQDWCTEKRPDTQNWVSWLETTFKSLAGYEEKPMSEWAQLHLELIKKLSLGSKPGLDVLWDGKDGQEGQKAFESILNTGDTEKWCTSDYASLLHSVLKNGEIRDATIPHPKIAIWGTLEARVQSADLVILGGLNEGIWPQKPSPDPWLNRTMRKQLGLLLPERNIGLSAHDFQQAIAQKKVVLSRAIRDGESPTVSSRWLTRFNNLLSGLDEPGQTAISEMTKRGEKWLTYSRNLDRPIGKLDKATRPAPIPPEHAHPKRLSVTRIKTLVRNPYEIYAQSILNLHPIKPYGLEPNALARGTVLHSIIEAFNSACQSETGTFTSEYFLKTAQNILEKDVPWPSARRLWFGRLKHITNWFVEAEKQRSEIGTIIAQEIKGARSATEFDFTLSAKADRLDRDANGDLIVYDYKSGDPPSIKETQRFDKQLQLESAIAAVGGFKDIDPLKTSRLQYIGLKAPDKIISVPVTETLPDETWAELIQLLNCYFDGSFGYGARLKMKMDRYGSDYDQLSRFGEWEETDALDTRNVP